MPRNPLRRTSDVPSLLGDIVRPRLPAETGWWKIGVSEAYGIGFTNSWANTGGSNAPPASWYLSGEGEVKWRGKVEGGDAGTIMFVIPEEARPEYDESFPVSMDGGGTANVIIRANGEVYVESFNG